MAGALVTMRDETDQVRVIIRNFVAKVDSCEQRGDGRTHADADDAILS